MKSFKINLLAVSVLSCISTNAFTQESNTNSDSINSPSVEKITVTGSQIKGVDMEGMQPVVFLTAEDIKRSGAATISELMLQINQTRGGSGSFTTAESGATSTSTPAGQAAASLRGLGPSSTLTLINGRRIAPSSFAAGTQNFVDINSIPLAAIESIEILASGASAIYGADAVAGVINYKLKKDYKGAQLSASYGNSFKSTDEGRFTLNGTWGGKVAGGNLIVFADYFDRNSFSANDRDFTRDPLLTSSYSYLPKNTPNIYFFSARSGDEIGNPNCKTELVTTEFGEEICAYYGNEDDELLSELESASAGLTFTKEIGNLQWNTDFFYSQNSSIAVSSPAPINQVDDSDGPWVDESALNAFSAVVADDLLDQLFIDPFDTIAGRELFGFRFDARFSTPRTVQVDSDAFRLVTGVSGVWNDWDWESAITLSQSKSTQVATAGIYNRYKYHALLAGELCNDGSIASVNGNDLSCGSATLVGQYNPFLEGDAANESLLAQAQERPTRDGKSTVYGWDAKISGDLIEFNDNMISAAFGLEVRSEEIEDTPSLNSRARFENGYLVDVFGFGSSLSKAKRNQFGIFAESYIPLTDTFEVQIAGRFDDYDDFGSTFNPKVGFSFRPFDELILRGSWSTSFRAPSLTQAGIELRTTTATFDCGANEAVSLLYCEGFGDERSPNVLELGNVNLKAEESESISFGFAFSPTVDTTLTVDYWRFDHDKLVDTDMTAVLNSAITDASLRHCGLVPTGETGISYDPDLCLVTDLSGLTIEEQGANLGEILDAWVDFDQPRFDELPLFRDHVIRLENTGEQVVEGIDLAFDTRFDINESRLSLSFDATHYLSFERNKPGSDEIEELIGTWRYPETVASARIGWSQERFYASLTAQYVDAYEDDIEGLRGRQLDELAELGVLNSEGLRDVDSWTTVRLNLGYDFENLNINLTINNLLDENPPIAFGSSRGFDSINHNALGANYRVSFTYFFE